MMRYPLCLAVAVFSLVLALSLLSGCEDAQARQEREAQAKLAAVLAEQAQAELGYVPGKAGAASQPAEKADKDLSALAGEARRFDDTQAYRQAELAKVAKELEALKGNGSATQQALVRRLLAGLYTSASRYQARQAGEAWAGLRNREAKLVSDVLALNQAEARAKRFTGDESASLSTFKGYQDALAAKIKAAEAEAGQLQTAVQQSTAQVKDLTEQRGAAQDEAGKLKAEALGKSGAEQFKLYEQATAAQRRADAADAKIDQIAATLSVQQSQLAVVEKQIALAKEAVEKMTKEAAVVTAAQDSREALHKKALSGDRNNEPAGAGSVAEELLADCAAFDKDYRTSVEQGLEEAVATAAKAVEAAKESTAPFDLLAAELALLNVRTQQAMVATAYGRTLTVVLGLAGETAKAKLEVCRQALDQVQKRQEGAVKAALEVTKAVEESQKKVNLKDVKDEDLRNNFEKLASEYQTRLGELAEAGPAQ